MRCRKVKNHDLLISDLHFGHRNVLEMCQHPFASIEEMEKTLIGLWNKKVPEEDDVYIIGDFAYRNDRTVG